ncbi:MAG: hypothetical protein B1H11_01415 [Desulfobacteraceae bacterium 4484_190.1]|nr:MAG: hypothetical protein B1H11_01415 [Desulfobacteraceae bacterium 4484_190.1]
MPFFPELCVMLKKLSLKYQLYVCGNFFSQALILEKIAIPGQPSMNEKVQKTGDCPIIIIL